MVKTFLLLLIYGNVSRCSKAANSADPDPILPNFKPILDFMVILVTNKNEEGPITNEGARVLTTLYIGFIHRAANSVGGDGIWQNFKLIQAFMVALVNARMMTIQ